MRSLLTDNLEYCLLKLTNFGAIVYKKKKCFDLKVDKTFIIRIPPIYEKLSDQFVYWAKFRYTPKGQLGKIL